MQVSHFGNVAGLRWYPPPPRSIGIIGLGENCEIIYVAQSITGKIFRNKELAAGPIAPAGLIFAVLGWGRQGTGSRSVVRLAVNFRDDTWGVVQPSLRDGESRRAFPALEAPGYYQARLRRAGTRVRDTWGR